MNEEMKQNLLVGSAVVIAMAFVGIFGVSAYNAGAPKTQSAPQVVSQQAAPDVVVQPLVVVPGTSASAQVSEPQLGGLIHNIQESFDEGIAVDGIEVISGTGKISVLAGLNIVGNVTSTDLLTTNKTSFTASASSQSLCSIRNDTGADRVLAGAFPTIDYATSTLTGGTFRLTISQSSTANATGTGSRLYYDNVITVPTNGVRNVTATSTISSTADVWRAGNYLNYLIASPTSTLTGNCTAPSL